jgi:translation initiation factor IF-3
LDKKKNNIIANEKIRASVVQLITDEGNMGEMPREQALRIARESGLDLVMLSEKGKLGLPVVKMMDLGKILYQKKKKEAEAKKKQKIIQVKEIKIRPKIGEHDFQTKLKRGVEFLKDGKRLKVTLQFRGREMATKDERGFELFDKINKEFENYNILNDLIQENDSKAGQFWSRIYSGLVKKCKGFRRHNLTKKNRKTKRDLRHANYVHPSDMSHIARLLPYK